MVRVMTTALADAAIVVVLQKLGRLGAIGLLARPRCGIGVLKVVDTALASSVTCARRGSATVAGAGLGA